MPKLRRLTGKQVLDILKRFGFEVVRVRGSHHQVQRIVSKQTQNLTVPVHGNRPIPIGTLKNIMRSAGVYLSEAELNAAFYADYQADEDDHE